MASLERQRLQLIEDFKYIDDTYGSPDLAESYEEVWNAVWAQATTKETIINAMLTAIERAFSQGCSNRLGDSPEPLPVDDDKRLQRIKRRWKID